MTTRLPNFDTNNEAVTKLKIVFNEMAVGKSVGPFVIAHIESVIHLTLQTNAHSDFKRSVIALLEDAIRVLKH